MGGKSTGSFSVSNGVGVFDGQVVDVPYLKAPGFIKVSTVDKAGFPDVSSCTALSFNARTNTSFAGYRVSFGNAHVSVFSGGKLFAYGYKADFKAPAGAGFTPVVVPFSSFSDKWDDATGNAITRCSEDKRYCPSQKALQDLQSISFWGEGVGGKVHLEIESIRATGCAPAPAVASLTAAAPAPWNNTCSGPIQRSLRFNLSNTDAVSSLPYPVAPGETLGEAVCCDDAFRAFAEPRETFARGDVRLFARLNATGGPTVFYDSVCGIPLFVAPRNRSLEEFKADTTEHGWPSFRAAELVEGNSYIDPSTGEVRSRCGTHLGSYLPDAEGPRWCLDLVCIAGAPLAREGPSPKEGREQRYAPGANLVTFDGAKRTTWGWKVLNDPVMGGRSKSTFAVKDGVGVFDGTAAIVPSLKAPGFCNLETTDGLGVFTRGADMSPYSHLLLRVRSATPAYPGFKVSLAANTVNPQFYSHKANFYLRDTADWQTVAVPFGNFSNDWSSFTGDCDTKDPASMFSKSGKQHFCCTPQHPEVCITKDDLASISQVGIWAEGHAGQFHLEIERISGGAKL